MNGYITVQEAAEKWGVTPRQVQILCKENRIAGASRMSRIWIIPENAEKPTSDKRGQGRERNDSSKHRVSKQNIDLSSAPWTMHEFLLVAALWRMD